MYEIINLQNYLKEYSSWSNTRSFSNDVINASKQTIPSIGFPNIEKKTRLYPGLYILGSISSLGKSTFAHQMCDQIAESGKLVLYISLGQNVFNLTSKSLSRLTAKTNMPTAYTSLQIQNGAESQEIKEAINAYKNISDKISIVECNFEITMSKMVNFISNFVKDLRSDSKPVIIIDYLQAICADQDLQSGQKKIEIYMRQLKNLQIQLNTPIIATVSLDRKNYYSPLDFNSFKELGEIESIADVIWGLQLKAIHNPVFDKQGSEKGKKETLRNAKNQNPRKMELVCLKNRFGISEYTCDFNYYPQYDYFLSK